MTVRYLSAEKLDQDDFGDYFTNEPGEIVWDAMTQMGPWATMTQQSFELWAHRSLHRKGPGIGRGQKYVRQENGWLVKEG